MIKKTIAILVFLSIIFISTAAQAYHFDNELDSAAISKNFDFLGKDLEHSYVKITTIGVAEGLYPEYFDIYGTKKKWHKKEGAFVLQGVGVIVEGPLKYGYIITAAHVVNPLHIMLATDQSCLYQMPPIKVLERSIFITHETDLEEIGCGGVPAVIVHMDTKNDIALLRFKHGNIFSAVSYKLAETMYTDSWSGDSFSLIESGDSIAIIARKRDDHGNWVHGFEVRYGKIISEAVTGVEDEAKQAFCESDFTMDIKLYSGDSGSPIFAFKGGKPVIIGIARATNERSFGRFNIHRSEYRTYAARIDFIKLIIEAE